MTRAARASLARSGLRLPASRAGRRDPREDAALSAHATAPAGRVS